MKTVILIALVSLIGGLKTDGEAETLNSTNKEQLSKDPFAHSKDSSIELGAPWIEKHICSGQLYKQFDDAQDHRDCKRKCF